MNAMTCRVSNGLSGYRFHTFGTVKNTLALQYAMRGLCVSNYMKYIIPIPSLTVADMPHQDAIRKWGNISC